MRKVCGVGINDMAGKWCCSPQNNHPINDDYQLRVYQEWYGMLRRCYSTKYLRLNPQYSLCQVCVRWRKFSKFIKDLPFIPGYNDWVLSNFRGYVLDKDYVIRGGKVYHPMRVGFITKSESSREVVTRVTYTQNNLIRGSSSYTMSSNSRPVEAYKNGLRVGVFSSMSECGRVLGIDSSNISKYFKGKVYHCKGYTFKEVV